MPGANPVTTDPVGVPGVLQIKLYKGLPPPNVTVAEPLEPPLHDTLVTADVVDIEDTVKVMVAVLDRHPKLFVPTTEYEVVVVGATEFVAVVGPDNQLYVETFPDAVKVVEAPRQIPFAPEIETDGLTNEVT